MAFESVFSGLVVEIVVNFYKNFHETITLENSKLTLVLQEGNFELEYLEEKDSVDESILKTLSASFSSICYLSKVPNFINELFKEDLELVVVNDGSEIYVGVDNFIIPNSYFLKNGLDLNKLLQYCEDVYLYKKPKVKDSNLSDIYPQIN